MPKGGIIKLNFHQNKKEKKKYIFYLMMETYRDEIGKMDRLVQILLAVLLVYNDVVSFSISSSDTI